MKVKLNIRYFFSYVSGFLFFCGCQTMQKQAVAVHNQIGKSNFNDSCQIACTTEMLKLLTAHRNKWEKMDFSKPKDVRAFLIEIKPYVDKAIKNNNYLKVKRGSTDYFYTAEKFYKLVFDAIKDVPTAGWVDAVNKLFNPLYNYKR